MLGMESVSLAHRDLGGRADRPVLVPLHGLLGSARNWQGTGRRLAEHFRVLVPDLRNHGESPHHPDNSYPTMAADVLAWLDQQGLEAVHLVGHSMGGKVAMYLACHYPERVRSLTVVDISPRAYPPRWQREFAVMRALPVAGLASRAAAEAALEPDIRDWAFRKFLVSNLERLDAGGFRWIVNLDILEAALPDLFQQVPKDGQRYDGPVLFLRGARSRFLEPGDIDLIRRFFPRAELEAVEDAGHNVHFDQPEAFVAALLNHIKPAS